PPPPGLPTDPNAITIPVTHTYNQLPGDGPIFKPSDLDQPPVLRAPVSPTYPFEMRNKGISGEVLVEFIVDSHGNVVATQAIRSTQREFEQPALQAVQKWKFRPGRKGGHAVNTRVQQTITFNITEE
ncbi:MAG: energy transducer TonB, partial [Opitutales bacterium]